MTNWHAIFLCLAVAPMVLMYDMVRVYIKNRGSEGGFYFFVTLFMAYTVSLICAVAFWPIN